jgi:uncharacterized damage-inducible protein DinB
MIAADPHLSPEERAQLLTWLDESRQEFFQAIDGVSIEQWAWKPADGRWSVGEGAEHVVLSEALLFGLVRTALAAASNPAWQEQTGGKADLIANVMPATGKAVAPDPIVPRFGLTHAQVRERFEQQRADIARFARETDAALKAHTHDHPMRFFGTLNAHQWLIYVPLHTIRHSRQIAAVKSQPGYPRAV